jgi:hypothetical protein
MRVLLALCLALFTSCGVDYNSGRNSSGNGDNRDNIAIDNSVTGVADAKPTTRNPCEGVLWKPVSQSDGALVFVGEEGDLLTWDSVAVFTAPTEESESQIEFCEYAGLLEPKAIQQVWRCSLPGENYTGEFEIEFDGEVCEGEVKEPGERND